MDLDELECLAQAVLAEPLPVAKFNKRVVFQAAASPTTTLVLIARVRELEKVVLEYHRNYQRYVSPFCLGCRVDMMGYESQHKPDCIVLTLAKEE